MAQSKQPVRRYHFGNSDDNEVKVSQTLYGNELNISGVSITDNSDDNEVTVEQER